MIMRIEGQQWLFAVVGIGPWDKEENCDPKSPHCGGCCYYCYPLTNKKKKSVIVVSSTSSSVLFSVGAAAPRRRRNTAIDVDYSKDIVPRIVMLSEFFQDPWRRGAKDRSHSLSYYYYYYYKGCSVWMGR